MNRIIPSRLRRTLEQITGRMRAEDGVALIVAAGVLMVVGILSAVVATASINQREQAQEDRSAKRALAAADAGVKRAIRQLNLHQPDTDQCVGSGTAPANPTVDIFCKGHGYLGGGAAYDFYVSQVLNGAAGTPRASAGGCVGAHQVISPGLSGTTTFQLDQRCIVSVGCVQPQVTNIATPCVDDTTGVARGVHRRVQVRTGAKTESQYFPGGLYGNERLCMAQTSYTTSGCNLTGGGQSEIDSDIGSNTLIGLSASGGGNAIPVCDIAEPPAQILLGKTPVASAIAPGSDNDSTPLSDNRCRRTGINELPPEVIPVPSFGDSPNVERFFEGCFLQDESLPCPAQSTDDTALPARNRNDEWVGNQIAGFPFPSCAVYAGDRELDLRKCPNSPAIVIPRGNYNFCRIWMSSQRVEPDPGATEPPFAQRKDPFAADAVRIFLDSPYREGSGCGQGNVRADGLATGTSPTLASSTWNSNGNCAGGQNNDAAITAFRCADGSFRMQNQPEITGGTITESLRFQIWSYGRGSPTKVFGSPPSCKPNASTQPASLPCPAPLPVIDFRNGFDVVFALYAPFSGIFLQNSQGGGTPITIGGAIRARDIVIGNNIRFVQDPSVRDLTLFFDERRFYRGPWIECRPDGATATDPRNGC